MWGAVRAGGRPGARGRDVLRGSLQYQVHGLAFLGYYFGCWLGALGPIWLGLEATGFDQPWTLQSFSHRPV